MSNPDELRAQLADPALSPAELARIAHEHPELRALVAAHPAAYPDLLTWLGQLGDPAVDAVLAARQGPTTAPAPPPPTPASTTAPVPPSPSAPAPAPMVPIDHPSATPDETTAPRSQKNRTALFAVVGGVAALALAGGVFALLQRGDDTPEEAARPTTTPTRTAPAPRPSPSPDSTPTVAPTPSPTQEPEPEPAVTADPGVDLAPYPAEPQVTWETAAADVVPGGSEFLPLTPAANGLPGAVTTGDLLVTRVAADSGIALVALDPSSRSVRWTREEDPGRATQYCAARADNTVLFCAKATDWWSHDGGLDILDAQDGRVLKSLDLVGFPVEVIVTDNGNALVLVIENGERPVVPAHILEVTPQGEVVWAHEFEYEPMDSANWWEFYVVVDGSVATAHVNDRDYLLDRLGSVELLTGVDRRATLPGGGTLELKDSTTGLFLGDVVHVDAAGERRTLATAAQSSWYWAHSASAERPLITWTESQMQAWDPVTAELLWTTDNPGGSWGIDCYTDTVAVFLDDGVVIAFDPRTGQTLWTGEDGAWGYCFSDGERIVRAEWDLTAFSAQDGTEEWQLILSREDRDDSGSLRILNKEIVLVTASRIAFFESPEG